MVDFRDTREWLDRAREMGELAVIKGADTKYEIGTLAQLSGRNQGPAVLFQEIKNYPADFRILTNMMANIKCLNLTLGLPIDESLRDTIETLAKGMIAGWENKSKDYPPKVVDSGPIL
ncbi:MAG: UbiD family decarboxylase, partial [Deltaproteobacteria bacterium]|nr:UbiD family decarboxylase [Deltaproteobacteria bacterium]